MKGVTIEERTIDRLLTLGTVTYETTGWGTGEIVVKCRSNTRCEKESLNKAVITFSLNESDVEKEKIKACVIKELGKKLETKEVKVLSEEKKKYNMAKRKFKAWKNKYKDEQKSS
ncbi:MAG: hypothetical protein IJC02_09735 [Lachnospiraceae bacterium]|nr:hypothetical protein [Lachnospiraceae bacterium]MBQ6995260.1 hypothetical protein [Lachnospiraceae bacterium]